MPASGPESGAATEVRLLVDQLQQAAWEARARLRAVEEERNVLAVRLQEAQTQQLEMRSRVGESANLAHDRDTALREAQLSARMANECHGRAIAAEKAAADVQRQYEEMTRQRDELRRSLDLAARSSAGATVPHNNSSTQLVSLRQARDAAQQHNRVISEKLAAAEEELVELRDKLEALERIGGGSTQSPEEVTALRERNATLEAEAATLREGRSVDGVALEQAAMEAAALRQQREELLLQLEIISKEVIALRQTLQDRENDFATLTQQGAEAARRSAELEALLEPLRAELASAQAAKEEAGAALATALAGVEARVEEKRVEAEALRHSMSLQAAELEQLRASIAQQEISNREVLCEMLEQAEREKSEQAKRYEAQRLQSIDLVARLEAAQQEIRIMSANLAEARLLAKAGGPKPEEPKEPALSGARTAETAAGEAQAKPQLEIFDVNASTESIREMRKCYQAFAKQPDDPSLLNELHCHVHAMGERADAAGLSALNRIVVAFGTFVQELYQFPEQITENSLLTIPQTLDFLSALMKVKTLTDLQDLASSTVYVVEDDELTCECITMVMEAAMMRGLSSRDPLKAACELASTPCDLIFLDIRMPGMDGFELCSEIRSLALHRDTPIIFVSGDSDADQRAKAAMVGGCDFLAKPFILCELTLKALLHIAKAKLHMA